MFLTSGLIRTEYGPISFHVFSIHDSKDSRKPIVTLDAYLNPFNSGQILL